MFGGWICEHWYINVHNKTIHLIIK